MSGLQKIKRKEGGKMLVGARAVNSISTSSGNTLRIRTRRTVVGAEVANSSTAATKVNYEEDPATQAVRAALDNFSWDLGGVSLGPEREEDANDGITVVVGPARNLNSVNCLVLNYRKR
jgi:hypothetical protein